MKLGNHQRNLLLSGIGPATELGGREVLKAVSKYNSKASKRQEIATNNSEILKNAETLNKSKIKQAIYEAEHKGTDFLDEKGEVKKDITAAWEVKNNLQELSYYDVKKKNLHILIDGISKEPSEPYSRKIKVFRDNYLFEKFQYMAHSRLDYV